MLYSIITSALIAAAVFFYFALSLIETVILCVSIFLCLTILSRSGIFTYFKEGFDTSEIDDTRYVHYGDTVLVWSYKNTFMRMHQNKYLDDSSRLSTPDEVPRGWVWEFFTIEDSRDPRWRAGSRNAIKYGDKIFLRTWLPYNSGAGWVRPGTDQYVGGGDRDAQCALTVENADTAGNSSSYVTYGDAVYLKTVRNMYVTKPEVDGSKYTQLPADQRGQNSIFRIYDKYGQGTLVDWATRGFATQSSLYGSYDASNAVDGNSLTFNHTNIELNAWWQVELPRDIHIDSIIILNRKDCCQSRIADFDITVLNSKGTPVYSKNFKDTRDIYTIAGVNRNGRIVKIQLRGTNYLHISGLKVHGTPVQYSTIVDTPVVADLISSETTVKKGDKISFHSSTVPLIGKNNSISISLCCKPESVDGSSMLLYKGKNFYVTVDSGLVSVNIGTTKGRSKRSSVGRITAGSWNHVGVVLKSEISPKTGWLYGEFNEPKPTGTPSACCFAVNPHRQEYYYLKTQGLFADAKKNTWSASYVDEMKYMGELTPGVSSATLAIYINGQPDAIHNIDGEVELTNEAVVIGQIVIPKQESEEISPKDTQDLPLAGFTGLLNMVRFYNYAVHHRAIQRDSQFQYSASTLDLSRGTVDANVSNVVGAHLLPSIGQEVSVSFWIYSARAAAGSGKADTVFWKGNKAPESLPYIAFMPNSNNLNVSITSVEEIKDIRPNTWYHVAQVIKGAEHMAYLNGKLVMTSAVQQTQNMASGAVHIGGFNGKIKDLRYHNFALSEDEVRDQMGLSPNYKQRDDIMKIWKALGCTTDLFDGFDGFDGSDADTLVSLMQSDPNKLEAQLRQDKDKADKGDIAFITKCYGKKASALTAELDKSSKLLKHSVNGQQELSKKCLPMAPFECKTNEVNDFDIRTHKDFYKYTKTDQIKPPGDLNAELAATKKALDDMKALRLQSEKQNKILQSKLQKQTNNTHKYKALHEELLQGQSVVQNISEQEEQLKATPLGSPADIQHARQLAAINLVKGMDFETLRKTPLFQEVLKEVLARTRGKIAGDEDVSVLKKNLQLKKEALEKLQRKADRQLQNTKTFANDVFSSIPGLDGAMINNIIDSKEDLSSNKGYQAMLAKIRAYATNKNISEHPDYQNLIGKLNKLTTDQVRAEGETYQDFKVQASKCTAMFEGGKVSVSNDSLLKMFNEKVKSDPAFKALFKNIIQSTAQSDSDFSAILKKAEDEKYMNTPEFQEFLLKITKAELKANPLYQKMLASLIGKISLNDMRIEDHPEYNKYADDMRQSCKALIQ